MMAEGRGRSCMSFRGKMEVGGASRWILACIKLCLELTSLLNTYVLIGLPLLLSDRLWGELFCEAAPPYPGIFDGCN
jgi:hypothetical protein